MGTFHLHRSPDATESGELGLQGVGVGRPTS
jgi:hypothetical protein